MNKVSEPPQNGWLSGFWSESVWKDKKLYRIVVAHSNTRRRSYSCIYKSSYIIGIFEELTVVEHPTIVYGHIFFTSRVYEQKACAPCPYTYTDAEHIRIWNGLCSQATSYWYVELLFCVCIISKATFKTRRIAYMIAMPTATSIPSNTHSDIDPFTVCVVLVIVYVLQYYN